MANLRKQYISRGKSPLLPEPQLNPSDTQRLRPNGIYSVRFMLSAELRKQWQADNDEQWGLIMLDSLCQVRRHWNVTQHNEWRTEPVDIKDMEIYRSTLQERQFAHNTEQMECYKDKYTSTLRMYNDLTKRINLFMLTKWQQLGKLLGFVRWED